jgi:hypothetical protein
MNDMKPDDTARAVVPVLACVLNQLCHRNDKIPLDPKNVSKFHALRPPAISILDYLERVSKYASCSGECFVLALIYIDRIIQSNPTFVVNSLNIHRLLITSVMLGAKFFDDQYFNNAYYAKVGGVPCNEVNSLEVEFLFMTNFTLFVTTDTYRQYYTELCNHAMHSTCGCATFPIPPLGPQMQHVLDLKVPATPAGMSPYPAVPSHLSTAAAAVASQGLAVPYNVAVPLTSPAQTVTSSMALDESSGSQAVGVQSSDDVDANMDSPSNAPESSPLEIPAT